ncbi:MAG TPA: carboxypeptidase-like regulatory domain-containing protein [Cytophagales bacterium]|jgi:hypothetical protein
MKTIKSLCLVLLTGWLATACTEPEPKPGPEPTPAPAPTPTDPAKGFVSGQALNADGKPIAGADIVVNNAQFFNSNILGRTDEEGKYKLQLTPGSWYVRGSIKVSYDGLLYTLDLHPETEGAFAGTEGAVRNLRSKLTGPKPAEFGGGGYYGGLVEMYGDMVNGFYDTDQVELTMEPVKPLIDGSAGKKLVLKLSGGLIGQTQDVAIGRYRITARFLPTGESLQLRLRNKDQEYASEVISSFEPAYPGATGSYKLTLEGQMRK